MPEPSVPDGYVLRLYVGGRTAVTERTLQRLYQLLEEAIACPYTLKVIDIFKHPDLAEADKVSVTPTLVRIWPLPVRRIVGELEDVGAVLRILGAIETSE